MSRIGLAPVLHQQKELSSLRSHYQHAFVRLIKIAQVSGYQIARIPLLKSKMLPDIKMTSFKGHVSLREVNGPDLPKSITHLSPTPESALYHHSRYRTEFEEVSFLAKGGFGAVYR